MTVAEMEDVRRYAAECEAAMSKEAAWRELGDFELAAVWAEFAESSAALAFAVVGLSRVLR